MHRSLLIGSCLLLIPPRVGAQWFNLDKSLWEPVNRPPFAQYAVPLTFTGPPAPVDLRSHPLAPVYRTVLRTTAKAGPNFADSFRIVYWGCGGTDCATLAIINERTGRVYVAPFNLTCEIHFRRNSRLLTVEAPNCMLTEESQPGLRFQRWYTWDGQTLVLQDSTRMHPSRER
jgi:hypothetical protein